MAMTTRTIGGKPGTVRQRQAARKPGRAAGLFAGGLYYSGEEDHMDEKLDSEALSAAIAGFLACHVLTLQFLIREGVIERERFIPFVEDAMEEMRPGIADQRSLFVLSQIVKSLRAPGEHGGLQ
jgi:hypothetical protein